MLPDPKMTVVEVADEEDTVVVVEVCTKQIYPIYLSPRWLWRAKWRWIWWWWIWRG